MFLDFLFQNHIWQCFMVLILGITCFAIQKRHCQTAMPFDFVILVGMTGFEPATSSSRTMRATKLCYIRTGCRAENQTDIPTERYYTLALGKMQVNFMFFLCKANLLHKFRKKCIVEII